MMMNVRPTAQFAAESDPERKANLRPAHAVAAFYPRWMLSCCGDIDIFCKSKT